MKSGIHPLMPVRTSAPFPKPSIPELLAALRTVEIQISVTLDKVVIVDILEQGIDIKSRLEMN
jgi:CxxC motif-containing protein